MNLANLHNALDGLLEAMMNAGALPADGLPDYRITGQIQRFQIQNDKAGSKNGWISFFTDGQGCVFGNWKQGSQGVFFAGGNNRNLHHAEVLKLRAEARATAAREQRERHREAAVKCWELWRNAKAANPAHRYLLHKLVLPHGVRQQGDHLLVPVFNNDGQLISLQFIGPDGAKRFKAGGAMKAGRMLIGQIRASRPILLCEGWATGATLYHASGHPVVVCFNAGNLLAVVSDIRQAYRRERLVICADNDHSTPNNPGLAAGMEAASQCRATLIAPEFHPQEAGSDFNDLAQVRGMTAVASAVAGAVRGDRQ